MIRPWIIVIRARPKSIAPYNRWQPVLHSVLQFTSMNHGFKDPASGGGSKVTWLAATLFCTALISGMSAIPNSRQAGEAMSNLQDLGRLAQRCAPVASRTATKLT